MVSFTCENTGWFKVNHLASAWFATKKINAIGISFLNLKKLILWYISISKVIARCYIAYQKAAVVPATVVFFSGNG
jgi:hypothetical protein